MDFFFLIAQAHFLRLILSSSFHSFERTCFDACRTPCSCAFGRIGYSGYSGYSSSPCDPLACWQCPTIC